MRSLCQSLMQYIELLQIKYKLLKCIYINLPLIWIWFKPILKKSHWSVQYGIKLMCDHVPHTDTHSHKPFWCNIIFPQQAYTIFALVHIWVPPHVFVCYRLSPFFFYFFQWCFSRAMDTCAHSACERKCVCVFNPFAWWYGQHVCPRM